MLYTESIQCSMQRKCSELGYISNTNSNTKSHNTAWKSDGSLQRQLTSRSGVLGVHMLLMLRLLHLIEKVNCPAVSIICFLLSILSNPILTFPLLFLPDESTFIHGMDNHSIVRASHFYHLLPTGWAVVQNCTRPQCDYCFDQMSRIGTAVSAFPRNQTPFLRPREKNVNDFVNHYLKN